MTFETRIIKILAKTVSLKYPENIYKKLTRKYERIKHPKGIKISFDLKATKYELSFPKSEFYSSVEKPNLSKEFDYNNIENLLKQFKEKALSYCTETNIVMMRNKQASNFAEELITKKGKIIYLPNIEKGFPEVDDTSDGMIITKRMLLKNQGDLISDLFIEEELEAFLEDKKEAGIQAEVYCPILYHEYVIGYISLSLLKKDGETKEGLDTEFLHYIFQFSKIIAYSLYINGYFKETAISSESYTGEILDISASGMLFTHNSPILDESFSLFSDLSLFLEIGARKLKIKARVMRKLKEQKFVYYGLLFLDILPEDFRFLFDYIYGRSFTLQDKEKWEGGAAPPELESF